MGFLKKAVTGIDLGNSVVKIALCKKGANKPYVIRATKISLPSDYNVEDDLDFYIESVKRSCVSYKIPLSNCALVANDNWYQSLVVTFPEMPKKDLDNAFLYEIKRQSNLSLNNIIYDYYPNRKIGTETEYYVFYSERDKIRKIVDKFKKNSIYIKYIDVREMIALAVYKNLYADDKNVKCFIDIGYINSKIIFTKAERLIFFRTMGFGLKHLIDVLKNLSEDSNILEIFEYKGISDSKIESHLRDSFSDFFNDIIRTINFFSTTYRESNPSNILYTGGIFAIPGMYEFFCQNLPYSCILNNVLDLLDYKEEDVRKNGFMFNYAVGAAIR